MTKQSGKNKVLLILPSDINGIRGGAEAVAIEMIRSLKDVFHLTVLTFEAVNWSTLETYLSSSLVINFNHSSASLIKHVLVRFFDLLYSLFGDIVPTPWNVRWWILNRQARQLDRQQSFDILICNYLDWDFGPEKHGVTYAHSIPSSSEKKDCKRNQSGKSNSIINGFSSEERMQRNHMLANSQWTANQLKSKRGLDTVVINPPVRIVRINDMPKKKFHFMAAGRAAPEKKWNDAVEIIKQLRLRGHDISLDLFLLSQWFGIEEEMNRKADDFSWLKVFIDAPRMQYEDRLWQSSFFINTCHNESFGIVVAEAIKADCICFARIAGGPSEILHDPRLLFDDIPTAIEKIENMLNDPSLEAELRYHCGQMSERFSIEKFHEDFLKQVMVFNTRC